MTDVGRLPPNLRKTEPDCGTGQKRQAGASGVRDSVRKLETLMPLPKITIRMTKDGKTVARFRDAQGSVRTSARSMNWTRAELIKQLADYGIALQVEQARAGIGSDGAPMPPLKDSGRRAVFLGRDNGRVRFAVKTYPNQKAAMGLQPIRDLYGPGKGGHLLDSIRVNYLDDKRATMAITTTQARIKARANEQRAPWWGWTQDSRMKLAQAAAELLPSSLGDMLFALGLIGASALSSVKARAFRRFIA